MSLNAVNLLAFYRYLLFTLMTFFSIPSIAQPDTLSTRIDNYLTQNEKRGLSAAVLIADKGEVVLSKGYGYADKDEKIKNTDRSVFDIGSITKQFTAAAILKLQEQGKLSLDETLDDFFDEVPTDKKSITLHQLLSHSSGISSKFGDDYQVISKTDFLKEVFARRLASAPGEKFIYANVGYSLLAIVVEEVSGQDFETYLYEQLLKPAGMEKTGYLRPNWRGNIMTVGFDYSTNSRWGNNIEKWQQGREVSWHLKGNGGLLSTLEDMYKWHQALQASTVLTDESVTLMQSPHSRMPSNKEKYYGYGWEIYASENGKQIITHNGGNNIYYAVLIRFVDSNKVVVYMTNEAFKGSYQVPGHLFRMLDLPDYQPKLITKASWFSRKFEGITGWIRKNF